MKHRSVHARPLGHEFPTPRTSGIGITNANSRGHIDDDQIAPKHLMAEIQRTPICIIEASPCGHLVKARSVKERRDFFLCLAQDKVTVGRHDP